VGNQVTLFASAARTATPTPAEFQPGRAGHLLVVIDVTAIVSTPSVTPQIQFFDEASGKWQTTLQGAAIATVSTVSLWVGPGTSNASNLVVNNPLPERMRVNMVHGNGNSATYTVGVHLLK